MDISRNLKQFGSDYLGISIGGLYQSLGCYVAYKKNKHAYPIKHWTDEGDRSVRYIEQVLFHNLFYYCKVNLGFEKRQNLNLWDKNTGLTIMFKSVYFPTNGIDLLHFKNN